MLRIRYVQRTRYALLGERGFGSYRICEGKYIESAKADISICVSKISTSTRRRSVGCFFVVGPFLHCMPLRWGGITHISQKKCFVALFLTASPSREKPLEKSCACYDRTKNVGRRTGLLLEEKPECVKKASSRLPWRGAGGVSRLRG